MPMQMPISFGGIMAFELERKRKEKKENGRRVAKYLILFPYNSELWVIGI